MADSIRVWGSKDQFGKLHMSEKRSESATHTGYLSDVRPLSFPCEHTHYQPITCDGGGTGLNKCVDCEETFKFVRMKVVVK